MGFHEGCGVEGEDRLFPHLDDEIVAVKCILTLVLRVSGKHGQHRVDADHLVEVRAVHVNWLAVLLLTLLERSSRFLGGSGTSALHAAAAHGSL